MYDDAFGVVRIETWSNEMMEAFHSAWDDVAKEGDRDPVFKRVLDDLEKFRAPKPAVSPSASSSTLKREGSTRGCARTASGAVRATDWSSNTR
jgi:hypothetical protein